MTDTDARLKALMRADGPAARDPWFRLALMERMARRRLQRRLAVVSAMGVAGALLLAAFAPALSRPAASDVLPMAGALMGLAVAVWGIAQMRRPI
jgi:hypothetical protein